MTAFFEFIFVAGIAINSFMLFLLIKKKNKELPHKLLIIFFCLLLLVSLRFYAETDGIFFLFIISFIPEDVSVWFLGPLLMLYIKSLFQNSKGLIVNNILHFIPGLVYLSFISIPVFVSILNEKYIFSYLNFFSNRIYIIVLLRGLILIIYLFYCLYLFKSYLNLIKKNYSSLSDKDFLWIKNVLIGSLIIISIDISSEFYDLIFGDLKWDGEITVFAMIVLIIYLGYYGITQSKILVPNHLIENSLLQNEQVDIPEKKPNIKFSEKELNELKQNLLIVLREKEPYLDEDLTLSKLSELLGTTDKKLSTFLNQYLNTSFYDLINKERIRSVKDKLLTDDYNNYTLLGIAFESGFKSKTSFNRLFKNETGLSPSEFRKKFKNNQS